MGEWTYRSTILDLSTRCEWSASLPSRLTSGERAHGTHWIGRWVGPRAVVDIMENRKFLTLPGLELRLLCRPARSQSLYQLRYPSSSLRHENLKSDIISYCYFRNIFFFLHQTSKHAFPMLIVWPLYVRFQMRGLSVSIRSLDIVTLDCNRNPANVICCLRH
jgi:hypothetical protein